MDSSALCDWSSVPGPKTMAGLPARCARSDTLGKPVTARPGAAASAAFAIVQSGLPATGFRRADSTSTSEETAARIADRTDDRGDPRGRLDFVRDGRADRRDHPFVVESMDGARVHRQLADVRDDVRPHASLD